MSRHRFGGCDLSRHVRHGLAVLSLGVAMASALSGAAEANNTQGAWSPLAPWPLIPIHAALLPDGRVLTYGTSATGQQTGRLIYDLWDHRAGLAGGHLTLPNGTGTDLFCNAQIVLPTSGDVFMAGGDIWGGTKTLNLGNADTNLFRPSTNALTRGPTMSRPRWYATLTTLLDGSTYIQGGRGNDVALLDRNSDLPERRLVDGTLRLLTGADTSRIDWDYPRNFLAPDGRVFGWSERQMYFVDPYNDGMVSGMAVLPPLPFGSSASQVMYQPGKILHVGGGPKTGTGDLSGTNLAYTIDINRAVPRLTNTSPMPVGLHWHNATVLPDGKVVVTGGSLQPNQLVSPNFTAYLWDPATGQWTTGASTTSGKARLYHSMALLLPDASVLVGGGGAKGPQVNTNAEIWYPPYLFTPTGERAVQVDIVTGPATVLPQQSFQFTISGGAPVRSVVLIKGGSVTHSQDMEQRFVPLVFTASEKTITATLPKNPAVTPPGNYMLFVVDANGVPSKARMIMVLPGRNLTPAVNWTPTLGTMTDGTSFVGACPSDMILVGMDGTADTKLRSVAPRCVRIAANGTWVGTPITGTRVGATTVGAAFTRTCPANNAMIGYRGKAGTQIDQVEIQCRPLAANGLTTGTSTFGLPVGGTVATPQRGPYWCRTNSPGFALYGRWGTSMRSFGVQCRTPVLTTPPA